MIGDGFCDDETNNQGCNFDGGDCCGSCILKNYCTECTCFQSNVNEYNVTNPLIGNGYCNDETNNPDCHFDGGDCCGPCLNKEFCSECQCLGENITSKAAPGPFCSCSVEGALDCKLLVCFDIIIWSKLHFI